MSNPCWSIALPTPPSVNNMFPSVRNRRVTSAEYRLWKDAADDALWLCKDRIRFAGKVQIELRVGKPKGLSDVSNRVKAVEDWLVRHQIIVNDDYRYVRRVIAEWDDSLDGAVVTVRSLA